MPTLQKKNLPPAPTRIEYNLEEICDERPSQTQARRPILPALRLHALQVALPTPDLCALYVKGVAVPQLALHTVQRCAGALASRRPPGALASILPLQLP